jgi:hypothetical protein
MAKAATKAKVQHPNPLDPKQWGDPIFRKIGAHQWACREFTWALDIPEIPQCKKLRARQESIMSNRLERAEQALIREVPETISGAVAALGYYLSPESGLSMSLGDPDRRLLAGLHKVFVKAVGMGPVVVPWQGPGLDVPL